MKKLTNLLIFLIIVCASLYLPYFKFGMVMKICISLIPVLLTVYLYFSNIPLFVPSLFFSINLVLSPFIFLAINRFKINIPQIYFLVPMVIYIIIVLNIKKLKAEIKWLKIGKIDRVSIILMVLIVVISAVSLCIWSAFNRERIAEFRKFVPDIPIFLLVLYGLFFPLLNSLFEEFISRAVLYDGFSELFKNAYTVIISQSLLFALWHYKGFPGGLTGVIMVFVWSFFLGLIRHRTKGMLAPVIAHYFADLSISGITLFLTIIPNKIGF